ncbi:hypothetical protein [Vibrio phage vB_VpS_CA8]|uniref:Uncharacterized protein n=1 Tax=Vibrio phage PH669 TaxID=2800823 RepID=A0A7U3WDZ4_9CAUD|nr:hypothetical protein [Vibrio phage vB_VpS_CA8]QEQ95142.1 hypothetical protein [Vibrio phage vB_VpS_BA3]QQK88532.1 hypothetical protein [Vibrio phage PH669]
MHFPIEDFIKNRRKELADGERYAGNQGVRKGKKPTKKQIDALQAGHKALREKRLMQHEVKRSKG